MELSVPGTLALVCGVLVVYSGDRLLEPNRVPRLLQRLLWYSMAGAVVTALVCTWLEPARLLPIEVTLGLLSLAYGIARHYPLAKTLVLTVAWWLACTLLPFEFSLSTWRAWLALGSPAAISLALSVAAAAILCDHKDTAQDANLGVRSVPVLLGRRLTIFLTSALALIAAWLAFTAGGTALWLCAMLILGLSPLVKVLARPLLGPLLVDGALALPGLVWLFLGR